MRKVIVQTEMSLDGVMNSEDLWGLVFKYHSPDLTAYLNDSLMGTDTVLLGRETYEGFAEVWPTRDGADADHINSLPKYVASRTLKEPLKWNARLLKDIAGEIRALKQQPGKNIIQYGVGELTLTMLQHGLIDELHFLVSPFVLGSGQRVFDKISATTLKLINTKTFESGVVALYYAPDNKA
jgi:dihydrofolate reductase